MFNLELPQKDMYYGHTLMWLLLVDYDEGCCAVEELQERECSEKEL